MQDTVHVQVQVVELRQERGVGDDLVDLGVPFRYPSVKLGNSHLAQRGVAVRSGELESAPTGGKLPVADKGWPQSTGQAFVICTSVDFPVSRSNVKSPPFYLSQRPK